MIHRVAVFCLLSGMLATAASAQTSDARSADIWRCFDADQHRYTNCIVKTYLAHDDELNTIYQAALELTERSGPDARLYTDRLRTAQRTWITFRDEACLAEAREPFELPDINFEHYFCLDRQTLRRIDDLRLIVSVY